MIAAPAEPDQSFGVTHTGNRKCAGHPPGTSTLQVSSVGMALASASG
jgi:hypothetical protein